MADKRIKDLTNTATESDLVSGNYFALDGSAGTKKLDATTLLTKTAQNALAGNVAPEFDATRDNTNPYKAGESVAYDGKTYTFKVDHYGPWAAADVEKSPVTSFAITKSDFKSVPNTNYFADKFTTRYKALSRFKAVSFSANYRTKQINSIKVSQIYKSGSNVLVILNVNDNDNGSIYTQDIQLTFPIASGTSTVTGNNNVTASHLFQLYWSVTFDAADYAGNENIYLSAVGSESIYFEEEFVKDQLHYRKSLNNLYDSVYITPFFAMDKQVKYSALSRIKALTFTANDKTEPITSVKVTQVYKDGSDVAVILNVNDNDNGSIYTQDIVMKFPIASGTSTVTGTKTLVSSHFYQLSWSMTFDATDYTDFEKIALASVGSDNIYFDADLLKDQLHYRKSVNNLYDNVDGLSNFVVDSTNVFLDVGVFLSKQSLRRFRKLEACYDGVKLLLAFIGYTSSTSTLQLIFNKDGAASSSIPTIYKQDIVVSAVAQDGIVTIEYAGSGVVLSVEYDVSGLSSFEDNQQIIASASPYVVKAKKSEDYKKSFNKVSDFVASSLTNGVVGRSSLSINSGKVVNLSDTRTLENEKLVVVSDNTTYKGYFLGIDDSTGKMLFTDLTGKIYTCDKYSDTFELLVDMQTIDANFYRTTQLFVLPNGNYLVEEDTDGDHIGGYWLYNTKSGVATKVFTWRNKYMRNRPKGWSVCVVDNKVYIAEYGISPASSGIGTKADATKLYVSTNYAESFSELYDFKDIAEDIIPDAMHIHSVTYDRLLNRIWVCTGDSVNASGDCDNRINWSDDDGVTWHTKSLYKYFGDSTSSWDNPKCLSMYCGSDFLLFGGDDYHNCIYRAARKDGDVLIEPVYYYYPEYTDRVTQFSCQFKRLACGLIVVVISLGDSKPRNMRLLGTFDGIKWYELYESLFELDAYTALNSPQPNIFEERNGKLYFQCSEITSGDQRVTHFFEFESPKVY